MSTLPENLPQAVACFYAGLAAGDVEKALSGLAPDVMWLVHGPHTVPYAGRWQGRDRVADWLEALFTTSQVTQVDMQRWICAGDSVVAIGEASACARATGRAYRTPIAHIWTLVDGQVVRFDDFFDSGAVAAAYTS